jgi:two-component system phosphate regulon sensor histidine kinase PhoR
LGRPLTEVVPDTARAVVAGLPTAGDGAERDFPIPDLGRTLAWTGRPTRDAEGAPAGLTLTFRDVTRDREIDRMKSEFVAFVAHQLRTPLSGIKWMLELAHQEDDGSASMRSYIGDAAESAERLIRMVNDLLNTSRLESGTVTIVAEPTDLLALTEEVLTELKAAITDKGLAVSVRGADDVPPALVEPKLFREVVGNLIANAIKYTSAGGSITIAVAPVDDGLEWRIQDTGIGVPRAAQAHLFQKFFRAENAPTVDTEGAGLGLYLARLVVERCGGRIVCESDEGRGSTFIVTLPSAR